MIKHDFEQTNLQKSYFKCWLLNWEQIFDYLTNHLLDYLYLLQNWSFFEYIDYQFLKNTCIDIVNSLYIRLDENKL